MPARHMLSHLLTNKGQLARAQAVAERALDLDPFLRHVDRAIYRVFLTDLEEYPPFPDAGHARIAQPAVVVFALGMGDD